MFTSSVALKESSQGMQRGREPAPTSRSPQPRHRSESTRLSDRRRPGEAVARKRDSCPGALYEGDAVRIFSRSADKWVDGQVVKSVEGNFVRIEYEVEEDWCGKVLHVNSDHLFIASTISTVCQSSSSNSEEEHDPEGWFSFTGRQPKPKIYSFFELRQNQDCAASGSVEEAYWDRLVRAHARKLGGCEEHTHRNRNGYYR